MKMSAVITTRNSERTLAACLASLTGQHGADVEIVVVDNSSTDRTQEIASHFADKVIVAGPERSTQRNIGARAAAGDIVVFLDADMVLEPGVMRDVRDRLADTRVGSVVIPERSFGDGFWARCKALEKHTVIGDPAVEAARGFRRDEFLACGGYDETLTACEDWELSDRMAVSTGSAAARTEACIWHDEGQLRLRGTYAKKRYYGRWVAAWARTAPPHRRSRSLRTRLPWLVRQPLTGAGMVLMKLIEAAGFAAGARDAARKPR